MTTDQMAFIRGHGITRCPPGPTFDVSWSDPRRRRLHQMTERELLNHLRRGPGVRAVVGEPGQPVMNLSDGDLGRPRNRAKNHKVQRLKGET
jgi:hypothetical protein